MGASAGSCELRRLAESDSRTPRPGERLLVKRLRLRVYGLRTSGPDQFSSQAGPLSYLHSTSDFSQLLQGVWVARSQRTWDSQFHGVRVRDQVSAAGTRLTFRLWQMMHADDMSSILAWLEKAKCGGLNRGTRVSALMDFHEELVESTGFLISLQ